MSLTPSTVAVVRSQRRCSARSSARAAPRLGIVQTDVTPVGALRTRSLAGRAGMALVASFAFAGCHHTPVARNATEPVVEWIQVPVASGGVMRAAVARPARGG